MTATKKKQAFDHARNSMWSIDPHELCLVGGDVLPKEERGDLDTEATEDDELFDARLGVPLTEEFINNIDAHGVDTPILIAKINDVATVIAGRSRVRAARIVNIRRKARGEPLIKVDCKMKRGSAASLMGAMIAENEARRDDELPTKIAKLKRYMNRGISVEDAAVTFNVTAAVAKTWLAFDDNAIAATKKAVEQGRISSSAAMVLARTKEPEKQKEALDALLEHAPAGTKGSTRAARIAAGNAGAGNVVGVTDKRTLKRLLATVEDTSHPHNTSEKTLMWWSGAEEMLKLVMGDKDVDQRLVEVLKQTYAGIKADKKAKK